MWENHVGTMNVPNFVSVHRAEVYEFHRLTENFALVVALEEKLRDHQSINICIKNLLQFL